METIRTTAPASAVVRGTGKGMSPAQNFVTVTEGRPIILDVEEFQFTYKCGHCGHEWSEEKTKEHRMKAGK
jgi:hypothetical protein